MIECVLFFMLSGYFVGNMMVWSNEYAYTLPVKVQPLGQRKPNFIVSTGVFPVGKSTFDEGIIWPTVRTTW